MYMWHSWSFNYKSWLLLGGAWAAYSVAIHVPNFFNEKIQMKRRQKLAKKYLAAYGYPFFHSIIDPRFDIHKLRELENKLA